ncbi:MAG: citrate synthase [Deltaproteobacteria bacterium]|nr:citrate synthase [Deltaproteobacteria bacterium]
MANDDVAELKIGSKVYPLPIVAGTIGDEGLDIRKLRQDSGYITLDSGYGNTGACKSAITFIDGEKGILRYRGIPIEILAEKSTFVETSYLLIYGHLPNKAELSDFSNKLRYHSLIHEDMLHFYDGYPSTAHPMAILSSMVCSLSAYYPDSLDPKDPEQVDHLIPRVLSKLRTIAAYSYKKSIGQPVVYPRNSLRYCENFLHMMFAVPSEPYEVDPDIAAALNMLLILHADHEQNCSTSTVRLVGSSDANLFASIAAGICALWGPKHGGANQAVVEMLEEIQRNGGDVQKALALSKDKDSHFKLMGFGHRVYKNFDPRAKVIKAQCDTLLGKLKKADPLLDIARRLEEEALRDPYFADRKLYPNVDFYSGVLYRVLNIPINMYTVMFSLGRLPGWIAHWREMHLGGDERIGRPRQIYTGTVEAPYIPLMERR